MSLGSGAARTLDRGGPTSTVGRQDHVAESLCDLKLSLGGCVLVDEGSPARGMAHAAHQLLGRGAGRCGQGVARVSKVVEVEVSEVELRRG